MKNSKIESVVNVEENLFFTKAILVKIIKDEEFDIELRLNLNRYLSEKYNISELLKIPERKGYFTIRLHAILDEDWKSMQREIIRMCDAIRSSYSDRELKIPLSKLDKLLFYFLDKGNFNNYTLPKLINESNIIWTKETFSKYPVLRNLYYTSYRSDIHWSFELLDEFKDRVTWHSENFTESISNLNWDLHQIIKFKNYLNFQNIESNNSPRFGSLSLNKSVLWNKDLINLLKDKICWAELCMNDSIPWDKNLINTFSNYVNFKSLSKNVGIKWDETLIDIYYEKWDWEELSGNPSINIDLHFLKKYQKKLQWMPNYDWSYKKECHDYPSISTNKGISWSFEMFDDFKDKLDIWRMAFNSKLDVQILETFKTQFDNKKLIGWRHNEYSDFMTVTEELFATGWENLANNKNFCINIENIEFIVKNTIELTFVEGGSLAGHGGGHYVTQKFKLIEILKNCEIDVQLLQKLDSDFHKYLKYFYNSDFINSTYWTYIIKPKIKPKMNELVSNL